MSAIPAEHPNGWTELLDILQSLGVQAINVKAVYGANGLGLISDTAAFQSAVNETINPIYRAYGGIVYAPAGKYLIGPPGITAPDNLQEGLRFFGEGMGGTKVASQITQLIRNGTHSILDIKGTGVNDGQQAQGLSIRDMSIHGNDFTGKLLSLRRCSDVEIVNVRLEHANDYALYATQAWNWRIRNLVVNTSGNQANDFEAVRFADEGEGASNTNTVLISGSTLEANNWHDIVLDGSVASGPAAAVEITNSKFERSVGYAVVFNRATDCTINNSFLYSNNANGVIKHVNSNTCIVTGNNIRLGTTCTASSAIRLEGGIEPIITSNTFVADTIIARAIDIVSANILTITIAANAYQGLWTTFVTDNRSVTRGLLEVRGRIVSEKKLIPLTAGESNFSRLVATGGVTMSNQAFRVGFFTAEKDEPITALRFVTTTTAAGATPTLVRYGVYKEEINGDLTLLVATPNDTTLLAAITTGYTKALSSTFNKVAGQRYALGILVVTAAAAPVIAAVTCPSAESLVNPRVGGSLAGQADLPNTVVNGTLVPLNGAPYGVCIP